MPIKGQAVCDLTEAQREMLLEVRRYIRVNEISPSLEDLAVSLGVSKPSAQQMLVRLVNKGYIKRLGGRYRNLAITELGRAA